MKCFKIFLIACASAALPSCDQAPPPTPPRPAADISVPPGLSIVADVSEPLMLSGASLKGEAATSLFRARLTPRAGQSLTAPALAAGASLRLRVVVAPLPERGEEASWIKTEGAAELSKSAGVAEYVYTGGEVMVRVTRDGAGNLVMAAEKAAEPGKK